MSAEIIRADTATSGQALYRASTDAAGLCREIVLATALKIQGRQYVRVEGWQAIAIAHGCIASAGEVKAIDGGWAAVGTVRRMSDGLVLAQAEGYVGDDEKVWANRPTYAKRAMAQTRAISRACRSAFAHVVVLIDKGLSTTPAEEVPPEGFHDAQVVAPVQAVPANPAAPMASESDQKSIMELVSALGWSGPHASNWLKKHFGVGSRAHLTAEQAPKVVEYLAKLLEEKDKPAEKPEPIMDFTTNIGGNSIGNPYKDMPKAGGAA